MTQEETWREQLTFLVGYLADEREAATGDDAPRLAADASLEQLWTYFRAYVNTRPPEPAASSEFLSTQDALLQSMLAAEGVATLDLAIPCPTDERLLLWRGDITQLECDAIVNAANAQMLGCWQPGHYCIDNCIHTFAGVQLRAECFELMRAQGHEEPTGHAKLTSAYNLPCKHVVHTVGPVANGHPHAGHRRDLASCYRSCLEAAALAKDKTLAFCTVSTGVFGFPKAEAAPIAVDTVREWLDAHPETGITAVFVIFDDEDDEVYSKLLGIE